MAEPARTARRWVILPCAQSLLEAGGLAFSASFTVLPACLPSNLLLRAQKDRPDVIVLLRTEALLQSVTPGSALEELFATTPTLLLVEQPGAPSVRNAARLQIHSVVPAVLSPARLEAALLATIAGFAVTVPRPPAAQMDLPGDPEHLTPRELDILRLMARGQRNKQMAAKLDISLHTVKFHVSSVLGKLGARTRTEAVTIGVTRGLVAI